MKCSIFAAAGLIAVVAAQNPSSALAKISSLEVQLASALNPPSSIVSQLVPVVPSSIVAGLSNPTLLPAIASALVASPPSWFTSLPAPAQSFLIGAEIAYASIETQIASIEAAAGITSLGAVPTGSSSSAAAAIKSTSSTGFGNSTTTRKSSSSSGSSTTKTTSLSSSTTDSSAGASAASTKASSSSSSAGAAPTGVIAAGVMGAVGVLGLALAL